MERAAIPHYLRHIVRAFIQGGALAVVLTLTTAFIFALPLPSTLALITSTLVIEYGAAPIGVGLGLHPAFVFFVLTSVALGVTITLFGIFDTVGEHSERIRGFLDRSREKANRSTILATYGMYGLVLVVLTLGFYVCPPVSWVMGWDRSRSIALIMAGYCGISLILILATMGFLNILFP